MPYFQIAASLFSALLAKTVLSPSVIANVAKRSPFFGGDTGVSTVPYHPCPCVARAGKFLAGICNVKVKTAARDSKKST
jgi:hypothetical protein